MGHLFAGVKMDPKLLEEVRAIAKDHYENNFSQAVRSLLRKAIGAPQEDGVSATEA